MPVFVRLQQRHYAKDRDSEDERNDDSELFYLQPEFLENLKGIHNGNWSGLKQFCLLKLSDQYN